MRHGSINSLTVVPDAVQVDITAADRPVWLTEWHRRGAGGRRSDVGSRSLHRHSMCEAL